MLIADKKALHAIQAMITIAAHTGVQPISGKEIAAQHELPPRYLEQMLQRLVRGELLRGVRGPHGGYVLAREKRRISINDIIHAVQADNDDATPHFTYPKLSETYESIQQQITEYLDDVTLQELAPNKITNNKKAADFTI